MQLISATKPHPNRLETFRAISLSRECVRIPTLFRVGGAAKYCCYDVEVCLIALVFSPPIARTLSRATEIQLPRVAVCAISSEMFKIPTTRDNAKQGLFPSSSLLFARKPSILRSFVTLLIDVHVLQRWNYRSESSPPYRYYHFRIISPVTYF